MINRSTISISESIGSVSIVEVLPESTKALLVLAHGAGAGMDHPFMEKLAMDLADHGVGTIRYNFPFMESGKRRPDVPAVAEKTVAVVCDWVYEKFKKTPIFLSGKSFGGRMSSQRISKTCLPYIRGIIFYGFPLHGIGKESTDRADHLKQIKIPMLFLQGTKDKLARQDLIKKVCKKLSLSTLVELEGADHSFKVTRKLSPPDLPSLTVSWIDTILSKQKT